MQKLPSSKRVYDSLVELIENDVRILKELAREISPKDHPQLADILKRVGAENHKKLALAQQLYNTAITDGLTGFRTRAYFETVLRQELDNLRSLGYLICDVDHFKTYNDTFGHAQGDVAIGTIAAAIERAAQTDLVVRYGGEEFSIFIIRYKTSRSDLEEKAELIRRTVKSSVISPFSVKRVASKIERLLIAEKYDMNNAARKKLITFLKRSPHPITTAAQNHFDQEDPSERKIGEYLISLYKRTVSIGGAWRQMNESLRELMDRVDEALYAAKQQRDKVIIAP